MAKKCYNFAMLKDEEIREIVAPILETLRQLEEQVGSELMEVPRIHLLCDPGFEEFQIGDVIVDAQSIKQIEDYLQQEIESMIHPTILH